MKILYSEGQDSVYFGDIEIGSLFWRDGHLCVRIAGNKYFDFEDNLCHELMVDKCVVKEDDFVLVRKSSLKEGFRRLADDI